MQTNVLMKKIFQLVILLITLSFLSCVGTVKDTNPKTSKIEDSVSSSAAASFEGIQSINAISHDKIELFFFPADGDPTNLTYEIYVNNSPLPIKIGGRSLSANATGLLYFAVTGLKIRTQYNFNMRVVESGTGTQPLQLDPSKSMTTTTFANETADFMGASSLQLGAGEMGKNTVTVKWVPATITGSSLGPKPRDPVGYEITYISALGGVGNLNNPNYHGADRIVVQTPSTIVAPASLDYDREYTINGLQPDTTYYVQVRAIHEGYVEHADEDSLYKREMNTHFLKIKTYASGALFDFNSSLVYVNNPVGEAGLSNLDVNWIPASGEFNHYRVCYRPVGAVGGVVEPIGDMITDADLALPLGAPMIDNVAYCISKPASTTNLRLTALNGYSYYQVKVIACKNVACDSVNRIKSDLVQKRVLANIAPFTGILSVISPTDETKLKEVTLKFDSPVISAGYLTDFKLYCYSNSTDTAPVEIKLDGTTSAGILSPRSACNGIKTTTTMPVDLYGYSSLDNIVLNLPVINGTAGYCLSLVPSIRSTYLVQESISTAVVRCFTPSIKTPTVLQFPGRDSSCSISNKNLTIAWPAPTGGLYNKYVVLYREKTKPSDLFNFTDAQNAYTSANTTVYKSADIASKTTHNYTFTGLIPGRNYSIGVLTYLEDGTSKLFSQYNLNTSDCALPLPVPSFNEWVDIFAVGPKEDGMTPPTFDMSAGANQENLGLRNYILETLDNDGIPVEIPTLATNPANNKIDLDTNYSLALNRQGLTTFNGVYGARDAKETNPVHQYSNSGIIRIGWKDVTFYNGSEALGTYIADPTIEKTPTVKSTRQFGYKVYRSEDNQLTWVDLTKKTTSNPFQTTGNNGLLHPSYYGWKKRNNETLAAPTNLAETTDRNIVLFTDYSVKFSGMDGEVDRARTYWYKVVPIFDGKALAYSQAGNNPNHHIIRVTLPPRNMALVHRMIANRTMCLEMNKTISKIAGEYYSCDYNGLGASGLTNPWSQGNTVYDLGGDLLIDRFELSCPITRGDPNGSLNLTSDSLFDQDKSLFKGFSQFGNPFKGCYNNTVAAANTYEPSHGTNLTPLVPLNFNQVIPGDCFGKDGSISSFNSTSLCSALGGGSYDNYSYPGSPNFDGVSFCSSDVSYNAPNLFDMTNPTSKINSNNLFFPTQSEFAAVYFKRNQQNAYAPAKLAGAGGQILKDSYAYNQSSCKVNLPFINPNGEYRPRWIAVNSIFEKFRNGAGAIIPLYSKTIDEIRKHADLYDTGNVAVPTVSLNARRMTPNSHLARIATSNSAKLPPLDGMSQADMNKVCGTYKVQVGVESKTQAFSALSAIQSKRLMRKKENIVAGAWPAIYTESKVTSIERGTFSESGLYADVTKLDQNFNACNSLNRTYTQYGTPDLLQKDLITPLFPQAQKQRPLFMSGSSSRDPASQYANSEKCVSRFGIQDLSGNTREIIADEVFCDYTQDKLYLGNVPNNILESALYGGGWSNFYEPDKVFAWVLSTTLSGSCSVSEAGAPRTAVYQAGGTFNSIYTYFGLDSTLITKAKSFDQDAVLSSRNGDGSFLDFGQNNLAPSLSVSNALSMETGQPLLASYFNPVLGMPLSCGAGCDTIGADKSDNITITADKLVASKNYDTAVNSLHIPLLDFPANNGVITNIGVSTTTQRNYTVSSPNAYSYNNSYVDTVNTGADPLDPLDNYFNNLPLVNGVSFPAGGSVRATYFSVDRSSSLKMLVGGGSLSQAGRYSMAIEGFTLEEERNLGYQNGGRCSVMINQE